MRSGDKGPAEAGLALDRGGESWRGWRLAPYGRARDWRLRAPNGQTFEAGELAGLHALALDVDFLRTRVMELEGYSQGASLNLDPESLAILRRAVEVLDKALPRSAARFAIRRLAPVALSA
jgi:hypothetical protein